MNDYPHFRVRPFRLFRGWQGEDCFSCLRFVFHEFHCLFTLGMSSVGIAIREFYEGTSKDEVRKLFAERIGLLKYGAFHGSGP